jgi:hypothetical protein
MKVTKTFADIQGRKYIGLDGKSVKVPWRYNRVMCRVFGLIPIQELEVGQEVKAVIECRFWDSENYLVLKEIGTE